MEKYFISENIDSKSEQFFENVFDTHKGEAGALFVGFPFVQDEENGYNNFPGLLLTNYGIYVFFTIDSDRDVYLKYIVTQIGSMPNSNLFLRILSGHKDIVKYSRVGEDFVFNKEIKCFSNEELRSLISVFQNVLSLVKKDKRKVDDSGTFGAMIAKRSQDEAVFDQGQFKFVFSTEKNNANVRIRGLAGSGKTILLAEKVAYLHARYPDLNIAYVFLTKSLKQSVENFVESFYKDFRHTISSFDRKKVHIIHGWGSQQYRGLYSTVCDALGIYNTSFSELSDFDLLCERVIKYVTDNELEDRIRLFDYVLIDEAQDFAPSFFKLAKMTLKQYGKLIYAYDELQILNQPKKKMPSPGFIFNKEPYDDVNLPVCYRTPKEIIVSAHALGLGIYHKNNEGKREFINVVQDISVWDAIGYKNATGETKYGTEVSFYRDKTIRNEIGDDAIECQLFENTDGQIKFIVDEIFRLVQTEDVIPDDIMIIDLDNWNIAEDFGKLRKCMHELFSAKAETIGEINPFDVSHVNKDSGTKFRIKGYIPFTTIYRAKGNESNIVFVLNANNSDSALSYNRNRLFTAMTRAKFKVYICGTKTQYMDSILEELKEIKENKYHLNFTYPTKQELSEYSNKIYAATELSKAVDNAYSQIDKNKDVSASDFISLFLSKLSDDEKKKVLNEIEKKKQS